MGVRLLLLMRIGMVVVAVALGLRACVMRPSNDAALPPPSVTAGQTAASVLTNALRSAGERSAGDVSWRVTQANSAHDVMVVEVEAEQLKDSRAIADEIVAPLRNSYGEVLIYIRSPGDEAERVVRRIQWTPDTGYVETSYTEP
jgi:hypothetical protein